MKKNFISKILGAICSIAMICAGFAVNSACALVIYEPEMPESAKALINVK